MALKSPELLHIELTNRCPLRCPQCYCDLTKGKDIEISHLLKLLQEAGEMKIACIALSGGEPLVYPHLIEAITFIHGLGMECTMATSGYGLTEKILRDLEEAGLDEIWISINGSNEKVHSQSRDCFYESLEALQLLSNSSMRHSINWVARRDNVKDFPNVVALAKNYGCQCINVLLSKPDSQMELREALVQEDFFEFAEYLQTYRDESLPIYVENCYSYLRAYLDKDKFFRLKTGCDAGRQMMAIDVEGRFLPCRHIFHPEKFSNMREYWEKSDFLKLLREVDKKIQGPCKGCINLKYCRSCRATAIKLHRNLYAGEKYCPLHHNDHALK